MSGVTPPQPVEATIEERSGEWVLIIAGLGSRDRVEEVAGYFAAVAQAVATRAGEHDADQQAK